PGPATCVPPVRRLEQTHGSFHEGGMSTDRYSRWRLILGKAANDGLCQMAGRSSLLDQDQANLDAALGEIYGEGSSGSPESGGKRSAGLGGSAPRLAKWLGDIRGYFSSDIVAVIQRDAVERKGLQQLLFEPETLAQVTPNVELVGTLMSLKDQIPEKTKE